MAFELKNINFQTKKVVANSQFSVDGIVQVQPEKPLKQVLNVSALASTTSAEAIDTEYSIQGKISLSMLYLSEDDQILTAPAEFLFDHKESIAAGELESQLEIAGYSVEEQNSSYAKISFLVNSQVAGLAEQSVSAVGGEEDGYVLESREFTHVCYESCGKSQLALETKNEVSAANAQVLSCDYQTKISNVVAGIDQVTVSGDVTVQIAYKVDTEICYYAKTIEFNHEVACLGANPDYLANAKVVVTKIDTSIETGDKNFVVARLNLAISANVYKQKTESVVSDLFSLKKELNVVYGCTNYNDFAGRLGVCDTFDAEQKFDETIDKIIIATCPTLNMAKVSLESGYLTAEGVVSANLIYQKPEDTNYYQEKINLPFAIKKPVDTTANLSDYTVKARITNANKYENKISFAIELAFELALENENYVEYVESTTETGDKQEKTSAITIYVAKAEDTPFKVARALGVSPEMLTSQNEVVDGKFAEGQRIFVYSPLAAEF